MNYVIIRWIEIWRTLKRRTAFRIPKPALASSPLMPGISLRQSPKISLLIPFGSTDQIRHATFKWLLEYWLHELPDAEIVVGRSRATVFCKGRALNNAAKRATGKVLVVLDADTYMPGAVIEKCASQVLAAQEAGNHLWYVPYRRLYRLNKKCTARVLKSDPKKPLRFPDPPSQSCIDKKGKDKSGYGHRFGAMITIMPREALQVLGCFDERFKGWGGEDIAILRALDTLYGLHKTSDNQVLHLHHPFIGRTYKTRAWGGQAAGGANNKLASQYNIATGHPKKMRELVDAGCRRIKIDSLF